MSDENLERFLIALVAIFAVVVLAILLFVPAHRQRIVIVVPQPQVVTVQQEQPR